VNFSGGKVGFVRKDLRAEILQNSRIEKDLRAICPAKVRDSGGFRVPLSCQSSFCETIFTKIYSAKMSCKSSFRERFRKIRRSKRLISTHLGRTETIKIRVMDIIIIWLIWLFIFRAWFRSRKPYKKWKFLSQKAEQHDGLLDSEI
jgi:hypothetical protein